MRRLISAGMIAMVLAGCVAVPYYPEPAPAGYYYYGYPPPASFSFYYYRRH